MPIYLQIIPENLPLAIESIGNQWSQESLQRMDGYPYYHWLQTENGLGEIHIDGQAFLLKPGEGMLIPPFYPHAYYPKGSWETCFVTFNGSLEKNIPEILGTNRYILSQNLPEFDYSNWISACIHQLNTEQLNQNALSSGCYRFLLQLSKTSEQQRHLNHPLFLNYVEPTIRKIETNYWQDLKVEGFAKDLFISPQYLTRLFRRFTNKSTQEYLTDFRILKAKESLINQPELAIHEVAQLTGFATASRFSELFKERNQMTPKEFRRMHY